VKLTLYYAPHTCATVAYINLTEAGADFEVKNINTRANQQNAPEFLALNPKHKVPVLLVDGEPLTENVAIALWISRQFPQAKILGADAHEEVKGVSLMAWCASGIHPRLTPNMRPQNYCDLPGSEESVKRVANRLLFEDFALADRLLAGREWFLSKFAAPDAHFFWCFRRAMTFNLDVSGFGNCTAHLERMMKRPSVQKVVAHEKRTLEDFARAA
jgi:glutathione S-transferase